MNTHVNAYVNAHVDAHVNALVNGRARVNAHVDAHVNARVDARLNARAHTPRVHPAPRATRGSAAWLAVALLALTSCSHVEVALPGVLDLRSDGAPLDVDKRVTPAMKDNAREGMTAWLGGDGVRTAAAGDVVVEGRVWWLAALLRVNDGDIDLGLRAVLGTQGERTALRTLVVTEEITPLEALAFYCGLPIPCVDLGVVAFMPTRTVSASGTRVVVPPPAPEAEAEAEATHEATP